MISLDVSDSDEKKEVKMYKSTITNGLFSDLFYFIFGFWFDRNVKQAVDSNETAKGIEIKEN